MVDVDVPWFPADVQHSDKSYLGAYRRRHARRPRRRCGPSRATCACRAIPAASSASCVEEVKKRATPKFKEAAAKRVERAERRAQGVARERQEARLRQGQARRDQSALHLLGAQQAAEARRHGVQRRRPQRRRVRCCSSSGRCRAPSCARAAAVSAGPAAWRSAPSSQRPTSMMVQVVGDGGFYFGGPSSVFSVAKQYNLPILGDAARQHRLVGREGVDLRVFPQGTAQGHRQVPGRPDARRRVHQDRRGVRRPRREGGQSGRPAGGAEAAASTRCAAARPRSCTRA